MTFKQRSENDIVILEAQDEHFTLASGVEFSRLLALNVSQGNRQVILNLRPVRFMDSAGLGALVSAMRTLSRGAFYLCGVSQSIHSIFKLTQLDRAFHTYDTEAEAIAAHRGSPS